MSLSHYASKRVYFINERFLELLKTSAEFLGEAQFTDYVFWAVDTDENLQWVRHIEKNVWPSMKKGKFYPFCKAKIKWPSHFQIFEMSIGTPLKQCNSLKEAKHYFPSDLDILFSFSRRLWEYKIDDLLIYIEDVDQIPITIEVVCKTNKNTLNENMNIVDNFLKKHNLKVAIPNQIATLVKKELGY